MLCDQQNTYEQTTNELILLQAEPTWNSIMQPLQSSRQRNPLYIRQAYKKERLKLSKKLYMINFAYKQSQHLKPEHILFGYWKTKQQEAGLMVNFKMQVKFWKAVVSFVVETKRFPSLLSNKKQKPSGVS